MKTKMKTVIKNLFLITALAVTSISFAQEQQYFASTKNLIVKNDIVYSNKEAVAINRVLTSAEKEVLQSNARFISECQWAVRDFAAYWSSTDGGTIGNQIGAVGYATHYKNHTFAVGVMTSGFNDTTVGQTFTILAKGMNLWDSAVTPFNADIVIDYMIANGKFEELAISYVALKTQSIIF